MLSLLFLLLLGSVCSQLTCEPGWSEFSGLCYKHFDTGSQRLIWGGLINYCIQRGGQLAEGLNTPERDFMEKLNRPSFKGKENEFNNLGDQLFLGIFRNEWNTWVPRAYTHDTNISRPLPWCQTPALPGLEHCVVHRSFPSQPYCYRSIHCNGAVVVGFRRFICKKGKTYRAPPPPPPPPPVVCRNKDTVLQGGKCVCKPGYIDIRESDALDRGNYREGERCVPKEPCQSLRRSFSVIFIVDASNSIEERNWPSLVDFLRAGARLLPNNANVGFIKFSTEVTFADWLPRQWTVRDFQQMVPTEFDAGYTNTPAAIHKTIEMFDRDNSQDKVAVLITDGLPVINEETDKQKGLADTQDAIRQLQGNGVKLVALGFGPDLPRYRGDFYMKQWLDDPEEDYFSFDKMACDLRSVHMQILLQKVCRRYV